MTKKDFELIARLDERKVMRLDESVEALLRVIPERTTLTRAEIIEAAQRLAEHDASSLQAYHVAEATQYLMGGYVPDNRRAVALGVSSLRPLKCHRDGGEE